MAYCWWLKSRGCTSWGEGSLSRYLQCCIHPRWLSGISSINSIIRFSEGKDDFWFLIEIVGPTKMNRSGISLKWFLKTPWPWSDIETSQFWKSAKQALTICMLNLFIPNLPPLNMNEVYTVILFVHTFLLGNYIFRAPYSCILSLAAILNHPLPGLMRAWNWLGPLLPFCSLASFQSDGVFVLSFLSISSTCETPPKKIKKHVTWFNRGVLVPLLGIWIFWVEKYFEKWQFIGFGGCNDDDLIFESRISHRVLLKWNDECNPTNYHHFSTASTYWWRFPVGFSHFSQQNQQNIRPQNTFQKSWQSQVDPPSPRSLESFFLEGAILGLDVRATFCLTTAQLLRFSLVSRTLASRKVGISEGPVRSLNLILWGSNVCGFIPIPEVLNLMLISHDWSVV